MECDGIKTNTLMCVVNIRLLSNTAEVCKQFSHCGMKVLITETVQNIELYLLLRCHFFLHLHTS